MSYASLIKRLQKSEAPDRKLDVEILTTVLGYHDISGHGCLYESPDGWYYSLEGDEINFKLPSPTGSLSTAITLVPEGWNWLVRNDKKKGYFANVYKEPEDGFISHYVYAATPENALCIAVLKERQS